MAMTGRFDANFTTFYDAVQRAVVELKGFDAATGQVESSMNRMVDTFSGRKIMTEATIMVEAIEKIGGASKLTADELLRVGAVAAEAAEKYRAWGGEVPANIQKYADAAKVAKDQTAEWGTAMQSFSGIASAFGLQTGIAAAVNFTKEIMAAAEELDKLHAKTGISVEALQRFQAVGDAAGNSLDQISGAALKLTENLYTGHKSTYAALENLGIKVEDFRKLSIDQQFLTIAAALREIPDAADQATTAYDLMGQKGVAVLPTLKSDIDAITAATKVMSEQTTSFWANAATNFKREANNMKATAADWLEYMYGGWTRNERAAKAMQDQLTSIGEHTLPGLRTSFMEMIPDAVPNEIDELNTKMAANAAAARQAEIDNKAWGKTMDAISETTFKLAMEHEKQWREESEKQTKAHNKTIIDGLEETKAAQAKYYDFLDKATLDSTDYEIKQIWEKVNAEKLAFKGSEDQRAAYNAAVDALGDAQTASIMQKAAAAEAAKAAASDRAAAREIATIQHTGTETQAELDKMVTAANAAFNAILADANASQAAIERAQAAASDAAYYAQLNPNGIDSSKKWMPAGGTLSPGGGGYPDTPEGRLQSLAAQQARYPTTPINTAYLFQGVPMAQSPLYSGPGATGGSSFNQTVNVTQPLGTSDQIARAVSDALVAALKGQGVRLPYNT